MKIGVYFKSYHIGNVDWEDFVSGRIGLSGTDFSILQLADFILKRNIDLILYANSGFSSNSEKPYFKTVDSVFEAIEMADRDKCDLMVFSYNCPDEKILLGVKRAEQLGVKLIAWCHNPVTDEFKSIFFESQMVKRLVCVSKIHSSSFQHHPVYNKVEVIHNSIHTDKYKKLPKENNCICFLGSITPSKGLQHLIRVWPKVKAAVPDARLEVIGSAKLYNRDTTIGPLGAGAGDYEKELLIPFLGNTIQEANSKGVFFLGLKTAQEIRSTLGKYIAGVVNPNLSGSTECCSVASIEIQASGTMVIGADRGGLKETIKEGVTGFLIRSYDDLEKRLIMVLKDEDIRHKLEENTASFVKNKFESNIILNKWIDLFDKILLCRKLIN